MLVLPCSYLLVIFRVVRFSAKYQQDLRARSEIASTNSGYSNGHISVRSTVLLCDCGWATLHSSLCL